MQLLLAAMVGLASLAAPARGHGLVTKPATRTPGEATAAICGQKMVTFYKQDNTSYPEALKRANGLADPKYDAAKCNLYLCKGFVFEDNTAGVQAYTPGQTIDMEVYIRIPHKGYANVSVVDVQADKVIGAPLKVWPDNYAASMNNPKDQTTFSVKLPDLAGRCAKPNECVRIFPSSGAWLVGATRG